MRKVKKDIKHAKAIYWKHHSRNGENIDEENNLFEITDNYKCNGMYYKIYPIPQFNKNIIRTAPLQAQRFLWLCTNGSRFCLPTLFMPEIL